LKTTLELIYTVYTETTAEEILQQIVKCAVTGVQPNIFHLHWLILLLKSGLI